MTTTTPTVTVYSKPRCVQCDATVRYLEKHHIPYTYRELEDHPDVVDAAMEAGWLQAPIVIVDGFIDTVMWGGFRATRLAELNTHFKENK